MRPREEEEGEKAEGLGQRAEPVLGDRLGESTEEGGGGARRPLLLGALSV